MTDDSETTYTPGKWSICPGYGDPPLIQSTERVARVARVISARGIDRDEAEANARLIAAAPDMKAALEKVVQSGHTDTCDAVLGDYECTCGWQDAKDALTKATQSDA